MSAGLPLPTFFRKKVGCGYLGLCAYLNKYGNFVVLLFVSEGTAITGY